MSEIPIYSCTDDGIGANVWKKISLYGTEHVCSIIVREGTPDRRRRQMELATMLCELLQERHDRER